VAVLHAGGKGLARDQGDHGLADDSRGQQSGRQLLLDAARFPVEDDEMRARVLLQHHQRFQEAATRVTIAPDRPGHAGSDARSRGLLHDVEDDRSAASDDAHMAGRLEEEAGHVAELEEVDPALAFLDERDTWRIRSDTDRPRFVEHVHHLDRTWIAFS
jgi:hypothetical protein